ncbi:tripartite motif-containing protein 34-like isoform X1 [Nannospalax galili]|nr:tripartite motif-containing protein 34-like isoform X1 [Nannospalax galili]XP_029418150.1 tripartite motif-containing protein 34-like isoform X1 [Nannospalax galili]
MDVQKEATCPVCLKLSTERLDLSCGHSVCQACIPVSKSAVVSKRGEVSCPVCGTRCTFKNLQASQHSVGIEKRLREVKLSPDNKKKQDFCECHGEKLLLFCKEDRKIMCWVCERSQEHRGHHTFLLEEAGKECQEKLQSALKRLRKEQQDAEKLEADIQEDRVSWKNQIQTERQRIQTEFKRLRSILDMEEKKELRRLEEEEEKILHSLAEAEAELAQQSQLVKELISDLELRCQWSTRELLQDLSGIMKWSEIWTLKKPKTVSKNLRSLFYTPDLSGMLRMFKELTNVRRYWADFTLNPENLNLNLILSEDQRQVVSVSIWPFKSYNNGILGSQCFSSGKHYWEVDVSKKTAWILGVYCRKRSLTFFKGRRGKSHSNVYYRYRPQYGYWVIGLQNGSEYQVFDDSSHSDPRVLTPFVATPPSRVGVFLNYEAGIVSFFNVTNHGSLIYKFSKCCFSGPAHPYFNPWNCPGPLTLCVPSS